AGDDQLAGTFLREIRPMLLTESPGVIRSGIRQMKEKIESRLRSRKRLHTEVKLGVGSIRDIEFLVQFLQLVHGKSEPRVLSFNTMDSLVRLTEFGVLPPGSYRQLRSGYVFLRSIEHSLQLLHNLQTHELPSDREHLQWLANRLDYPDADTLLKRFEEHRLAVRTIFEQVMGQSSGQDASGPGGMVNSSQSQGAQLVTHAASERVLVVPADYRESGWQPDEFSNEVMAAFRHTVTRLIPGEAATVECHASADESGNWKLVLCGTQFSDWLSTVCGLLAIHQIDIRSGHVFSQIDLSTVLSGEHDLRFFGLFEVRPWGHRDEEHAAPASAEPAKLPAPHPGLPAELQQLLTVELARLCHNVQQGRIDQVRSELLQRVAEVMNRRRLILKRDDSAAEIVANLSEPHVQPGRQPETLLSIEGADTLGFLFEVTASLALSGFRVQRGTLESVAGRVRDELIITEADGGPVRSEIRRDEIALAVTLIKQFTHWLPSTADPVSAVRRFRELISRLQTSTHWAGSEQALQRPEVLKAVASAVGITQHLWNDFLRGQQEELFPILSDAQGLERAISFAELVADLQTRLAVADDDTPRWLTLNHFKDHHLFRIDMRHILGYCRPFGTFAQEITELAEVVVMEAFRTAFAELTQEFGVPSGADGSPCPWMIAGLGKFGGIEMGFASDIELLLIYQFPGRTNGRHSLANNAFFDRLVTRVASGISARTDAIFHVDLRMCPYGQAGSPAVALDDLKVYYSPAGPAWPYERQALVKFRPIGNPSDFAHQVLRDVHECIYGPGYFDFASMRAMRERQVRQLVRGGTINAKLSEGCLVDCEYAVQALQMTHGRSNPSLRHPNTLRSLRQAGHLSLVSPVMQQDAEQACVFFRQLIDCLRMVRGNAHDLTIPGPDSDDFVLLQRRMQAIHDAPFSMAELEKQVRVIRDFSAAVERLCKLTWTTRPPTGPGSASISTPTDR
ncbi:MAG: hypothetical protein KDA85_13120, partial [Planctomycetaceae bacterium]|nr:hypothetical protein [Planctomycetaceae bacterium]